MAFRTKRANADSWGVAYFVTGAAVVPQMISHSRHNECFGVLVTKGRYPTELPLLHADL